MINHQKQFKGFTRTFEASSVSRQSRRGFTLIELLVVIAIIGILAAAILSGISSAREGARDARRLQDMRQIQTALEMYHLDHGQYPNETNNADTCRGLSYECSTEDDEKFLDPLVDEGYLSNYIVDPLNDSDYYYTYFYAGGSSPYDCKNSFYVLMAFMEGEASDSSGFTCGTVNWQPGSQHGDWVEGRYD